MDELIQQLLNLLEMPAITLDEPVKVIQIVKLAAILGASLLLAGFLRRWFRRLFIRLKMPQNVANRLLALLFLIIVIVGGLWRSVSQKLARGSLVNFFTIHSRTFFKRPR